MKKERWHSKKKVIMKKQKYLSSEERNIIEGLVQVGKSNKAIAEVLWRATSTIGRELERNCWRFGCRKHRSETADELRKNDENESWSHGFLAVSGRKSSNCTTMIGVRSKFLERWNCKTFALVTKRFIAGFMRKFERADWIGNICVGIAKSDGGGWLNESLEI